ncbi:MAG: hypothetical protein JNK40_01930 [Chromatiales bacterium]|nr:hypothetical protein [Chromatiales bacterium]
MGPQAEDDLPVVRRWPPRMRVAAAIGWSSFLAACLGTLLTFAALDPQVIIDGVEGGEPGAAPWWLTRTGIYSIGFFLFWAIGAVAGMLTDYLHEAPPSEGHGP